MQKKKQKQVSALQKALAKACGIKEKNPSDIRQKLTELKTRSKSIRNRFGINQPWEYPTITAENKEDVFNLVQKEDLTNYIYVIRCILLGWWAENKIVYRIDAETMDFIHNEFKARKMQAEINDVLSMVCKEPVYLEFEGKQGIQGAFCGLTFFLNETSISGNFLAPDKAPLLFSIMNFEENDRSQAALFRCASSSVQSVIEGDETSEAINELHGIVVEVLAYICYLKTKLDAIGHVLVPESIQNGTCFRVLPLKNKETMIDLENPSSWMRGGLCNFMGYLDRAKMLEDIQREFKLSNWDTDQPIDLNRIQKNQNLLMPFVKKQVLEWEYNRVVYQFDEKTENSLVNLHYDTIFLEGFSPDLMQYMPFKTMVLYQDTLSEVTLVSQCKLSSGCDGLLVTTILQDDNIFSVFPCNKSPLYGFLQLTDETSIYRMTAALCSTYQILTVMKKKAEKQLEKQLNYPEHTGIKDRPGSDSRKRQDYSHQCVRESYSIVDTIKMFDLTTRTVKQVADKDAAVRGGWKMVPHIRRRHPHRYWIGKGDNKHLEVRWLEDMKINYDDRKAPDTTVVHSVKV